MVDAEDRERLVYGNILEAYDTGLFGEQITRTDKSRELMQHLASLNIKEILKGLDAPERSEQQRLRSFLPLAAHSTVQPSGTTPRPRDSRRGRRAL